MDQAKIDKALAGIARTRGAQVVDAKVLKKLEKEGVNMTYEKLLRWDLSPKPIGRIVKGPDFVYVVKS
jgi:hypothetical protein